MTERKKIGIVSGGQLGRMLSEPAINMGFDVIVLDPTPNCPAAQVGAKQIVGSWKDGEKIKELLSKVDYFTIEIEHIDVSVLEKYENELPINPAPKTIKLIQNKYEQKKFLKMNGLPIADFNEITSLEQAQQILEEFGGKLILKSKLDAYDGRGNAVVENSNDLLKSFTEFSGRQIYAEKIIAFKKEIAVMVAKDMKGNLACYPATETLHARNICIETYTPAEIKPEITKKAEEIAKRAVSLLDGAGVYGIEMFLTHDDQIIINEIAPRVHNSGHYTMDACETSQFEQHIRAVTGQELGSTNMKVSAAAMVNILGERDGEVTLKGVEEAEAIEGVSVYVYGKTPTNVDRKMGHINAVGATIEEAIDKARKARGLIQI